MPSESVITRNNNNNSQPHHRKPSSGTSSLNNISSSPPSTRPSRPKHISSLSQEKQEKQVQAGPSSSPKPAAVSPTHSNHSDHHHYHHNQQPPQAQRPIGRSLSFKIPLRVSTDPERFSSSQGRSRAQSLPPQSAKRPQHPPLTRHASRFSLSAISQSPLATSKPQYIADSSPSSLDGSTSTPTEQFLLARGLPISEPEDPSSAEALQDQVVRYLTTMSTPQTKTPAAEPDRAPSYPAPGGGYGAPGNNAVAGAPKPGPPPLTENMPLPNLSGTANGPVGNLLKGPVGPDGKLKDAALMVGIKLDLEAEVHVSARVRGDILVGLY